MSNLPEDAPDASASLRGAASGASPALLDFPPLKVYQRRWLDKQAADRSFFEHSHIRPSRDWPTSQEWQLGVIYYREDKRTFAEVFRGFEVTYREDGGEC